MENKYEELREKYAKRGYDEELIKLLIEREKTFEEYFAITKKLNPLANERDATWSKIRKISALICKKRGHQFNDKHLTKANGFVYHCAECGRMVGELELTDKDSYIGVEDKPVLSESKKRVRRRFDRDK